MASDQEPEVQFAQRLASNEKPIRTKAIKKLRKYISVRSQKAAGGFTSAELLKLWKGLFYCLWMQDKPLLQEELSHQISSLIHNFHSDDGQFLYLECFLQTFKREWTGIDRLRMDKFFQIVRFMFRQTFEMLRRRNWESSVVSRFLELLTAQLLHSSSEAPSGLTFHILDLYMTELAAVGSAELTADQNLIFIEPFCKTAAKTKDRTLFRAICSSIFSTIIEQAPFAIEDLMKELKAAEDSDSDSGQASEEDDKDEQLKKETSSKAAGRKGKQINGKKSNEEEEDDEDDDELLHLEDELLHLEDSDTEAPCDDDMGPVLQFDYLALAEKLFELASRSNTPSQNRQRLYKIIKVLRDLSEGIFPQDEYPEEVSTDEDDDMFGSRKRMKRKGGHKEGDEEGAPAKKKSKGKKKEASTLNKQTQDTAGDDDAPADLTATKENKKKKKKKKKKKRAGQGGETASSVTVTEAAAADGQRESLLLSEETMPSVTVTEETSQPTSCTTDGHERDKQTSPNEETKETSELKPAEQQDPDGTETTGHDAAVSGKKKKRKKGLKAESQVSTEAVSTPSTTEESTPETETAVSKENNNTEKSQEEVQGESQVNSVSTGKDDAPTGLMDPTDSKTPATKKKKKKKDLKADEAANVKADAPIEVEVKHPDAEITSAGEETSPDAATVQLKKKTKKKGKQEREDATPEASPAAQVDESRDERQAQLVGGEDGDVLQDETEGLSSSVKHAKKKKKKRKIPVVFEFEADELEAAALINGLAEEEIASKKTKLLPDTGEPTTPLSTKKAQKKAKTPSGTMSDFITFQSNAAVPTPLFCRTKGSPGTPLSSKKRNQTPKSESKKVTFGLKNNKTAEFKKTDRSLLVSPDGSSRVPFDPKQKPKFGVLKSPTTPLSSKVKKTPNGPKKSGGDAAKRTPKRRPSAADFF